MTSGSFSAATTLVNLSIRLDKTDTNGGSLTIKAGKDIFVADDAALTLSRVNGSGAGGNLTVVAETGTFNTGGGRLTSNGRSGDGGASRPGQALPRACMWLSAIFR